MFNKVKNNLLYSVTNPSYFILSYEHNPLYSVMNITLYEHNLLYSVMNLLYLYSAKNNPFYYIGIDFIVDHISFVGYKISNNQINCLTCTFPIDQIVSRC